MTEPYDAPASLPLRMQYLHWAQKFRVPLGFLAVLVFVLLMEPRVPLLIAGSGIGFCGLLFRFWAAGYLHKARTLTTAGPYRFTRNPLYFGSFIMLIGLAVTSGSWISGLVFVLLFALIYIPTMLREEDELRRGYQESYDRYAAAVPRFLPRHTRYPSSGQTFRFGQAFKNREQSAFFGYLLVLLVISLKLFLRR